MIVSLLAILLLAGCLYVFRVALHEPRPSAKVRVLSRFLRYAGPLIFIVTILAWRRHDAFALQISFVSGMALVMHGYWAVRTISLSRWDRPQHSDEEEQ